MVRVMLTASVCAMLGLVACQKSPTEKQAEALSDGGRIRADSVRQRADIEAVALDRRANDLSAKAKAAGGYTGERLAVQAHAVEDEAVLVRKQGRAQAESVEEAANAEAKAVRSH